MIQKCIVISNGIEVERFMYPKARDFRSELGIGTNVFLIGFLGRFMSPKGFRYLVDAIEILSKKNCSNKKPIVISFGDGGFLREEKARIHEKNLDDYFIFLPITRNVASAIKGLDIVAMPSLWEACGLLAMETLSCGTPLIGTNCIGLREVLKGTPAILVEKANPVELARALENEMTNCSKELFFNYKEVAIKRFDVRETSYLLLQLYDKIINKNVSVQLEMNSRID